MKMYVFHASTINADKVNFIAGCQSQPYSVPVPYFLIQHEKGYVLFDTGHNLETVKDAANVVPKPLYEGYRPEPYEDGYVLNALERVGVKPEEIMYVICSHLHFDHAGGLGHFPNATYIVQKQELHYAYVPDAFMKMAYFRQDFDRDLNWLFLNGWTDNRYDVFGDGKLIIYFTPGHTPGHQSLLVNLENEGSYMLTSDACYIEENLDKMQLSGLACDNLAFLDNLKVFKDLQKRGVNIFFGHDPEQWKSVKVFPEFYS